MLTSPTKPARSQRSSRAFTLIELMIVVAIIGILAAVAIPAFVKYVRRSKTTEPLMNIRKMYDAAVLYYESERVGPNSLILPRQFPDSQAPTPGLGACCVLPSSLGGKCQPQTSYWTSLTWTALHFSVDDPFYYSYQFISSGTDRTAQMQAMANGDLNCNGRYSTFERIGSVDSGGNPVPSPGLYVVDDLE